MKRPAKDNKPAFDVAEYPLLQEFFSGYLHEDFQDEYGSAAAAVATYFSDATEAEVAQARKEWARMRKSLAGTPMATLQEALRQLGAAWRPQSESDLKAVDAAFAKKG